MNDTKATQSKYFTLNEKSNGYITAYMLPLSKKY